jgi:hypothetical protein
MKEYSSNHVLQSQKFKMTTENPASITTPDAVDTRLGTLRYYTSK